VLGVLYGIASGVFAPASSGLLPELVRKDLLQQANAVLGVGRNACRIVGPLVAGLIVLSYGAGWAFLIDAVTFGVDGLLLLSIGRRLGVAKRQVVALWPAFMEGLRELRGRGWYVANLGVHSLWNMAMAGFYVLGPVVVVALADARSWGIVSAVFAAGSLIGGLVAVSVVPKRPLLVCNLLIAVAALPLLALGARWPIVLIAVAAAIAAASSAFVNEVWTGLAQRSLPRASLSRLMSFDWLVSQALSPLGYVLVGVGGDRLQTGPTLLIAAALTVVPALALAAVTATGKLVPPPEPAEEPAAPSGAAVEAAT
jgi:MFS family permease